MKIFVQRFLMSVLFLFSYSTISMAVPCTCSVSTYKQVVWVDTSNGQITCKLRACGFPIPACNEQTILVPILDDPFNLTSLLLDGSIVDLTIQPHFCPPEALICPEGYDPDTGLCVDFGIEYPAPITGP